MSESRPSLHVLRSRCFAVLGLVASMAWSGCPGTEGGNHDPDAGAMSPIELTYSVQGGGTGDWELVTAGISIAGLDVQSDIGESFDPHITALGFVSLKPDSQQVEGDAPPATYSQISIQLAPSATHATFELTLSRSTGQTVIIQTSQPLDFDVRCDSPASVEPTSMLKLTLILDGAALVAAVDAAGIPAMAGTTTLDETSAPSLISAIDEVLANGFTLACAAE